MSDIPHFVDIHCHTTLRALNTYLPDGSDRNPWDHTENKDFENSISRWAKMKSHEIAKVSQGNLYNVAEGNFRIVFDSLYPAEKSFLDFSRIPSLLMNKQKKDQALITVLGVDPPRLKALRRRKDYFKELAEQYEFLKSNQGMSPDGRFGYQIAKDFQDVELINNTPGNIAIVPTIEGGHAFGVGTKWTEKEPTQKLKEKLSRNIKTIKNWEHPPLFVNLAHHFWNQLCGHARSFKPVINTVFNQNKGMGGGITELGWHVLREMLTRRNGRRIQVDIKHMSLLSRLEFYDFVRRHNYINPGDKIPIICSHGGVNGYATMRESVNKRGKGRTLKNSYFNSWAINLSDEEIAFIHETGGLIGIMMDKALLGSVKTITHITSMEDPEQKKLHFLQLILDNIFHMVKAVGHKGGWDIISLGTDYDGLIMHVDSYPDAKSMLNLHQDLIKYLEDYEYHKDLWFGYEPKEIINKIFYHNPVNFLRKHFWDNAQTQSVQPRMSVVG